MGLFDKKKKGGDDYDSPVEQVNLGSPQRAATPPPPAPARAPGPGAAVPPAASLAREPAAPASAAAPAPAPAPVAARPAPAPIEPDSPDYGIEKAIELMRLLPADNVQLVVQVVKKTLESLGVQVSTIIRDASRKQSDIEGRIDVYKKEIVELESEISTRKSEITRLEADHTETSSVKERLVLAEKLTESEKAAATKPASPLNTTGSQAAIRPTSTPTPTMSSATSGTLSGDPAKK
jgi:translation initiation factor IF-2